MRIKLCSDSYFYFGILYWKEHFNWTQALGSESIQSLSTYEEPNNREKNYNVLNTKARFEEKSLLREIIL